VHVKRRQLEKCRDSAAVVETRQKICKSKIKQTHFPRYQKGAKGRRTDRRVEKDERSDEWRDDEQTDKTTLDNVRHLTL